jgi:hypothetical protein
VSSKHDESVRWCKRCEQLKPKDRFLAWSTSGGKVQQRGHCLDCRENFAEKRAAELVEYRRQYNAVKRSVKRERDRQRREEVKGAVNKLKDAPCLDCGNRFPPVAMDFDHLGGKTKSIASMVGQAYKLDLILEEISRCALVCACCHRVRTEKRRQNLVAPVAQPKMRPLTAALAEDVLSLFADSQASLAVTTVREKLRGRGGSINSRLLRTLVSDGRLVVVGRGVYRLPSDEAIAPKVKDLTASDRALASMSVRNRIVAWFAMNPSAVLTTADVIARVSFGDKASTVGVIMCRLCAEGRLVRDGARRGSYRLPSEEEAFRQEPPKITPSMKREHERLTRLSEVA